MFRTRMFRGLALVCGALVLASGCEYYDRPFRPLPSSMRFVKLNGEVLDSQALRGKPWVIALWVPGCGICARELPRVEQVRREFEQRGIGFLAVSLETDPTLVARAAARYGIQGDIATVDGEVLAPLGVRAVPSLVFLDREGVIVAAATGERSLDFLRKRVSSL